MNTSFISAIIGIAMVALTLLGLASCGGVPTGGQELTIPPSATNLSNKWLYIFTKGERGKAMVDYSNKYVWVTVINRAGERVSSVKRETKCFELAWRPVWKESNKLSIEFFDESNKASRRFLFVVNLILEEGGMLLEQPNE